MWEEKEVKGFIIVYLLFLGIISLFVVSLDDSSSTKSHWCQTVFSSFKTKLEHFKKGITQKFDVSIVGTMGLIAVLSFAILQLFQLEDQMQGLRANNRTLQSEVKNETKNSTKTY